MAHRTLLAVALLLFSLQAACGARLMLSGALQRLETRPPPRNCVMKGLIAVTPGTGIERACRRAAYASLRTTRGWSRGTRVGHASARISALQGS